MPNALRVLVNLSYTMKRDSMGLSFQVGELEGLRSVLRKRYFLQWHQDNSILGPIVVTQLELPLGEFRIPSDAVEKFVNGNHLDQ